CSPTSMRSSTSALRSWTPSCVRCATESSRTSATSWIRASMCVEWGSIAEWVTAGVAVAAAGAAFWALRYNKAANAHAQDAADAAAKSNELTAQAYRDDVRVRDEAQARLVYATLDAGHPVILGGTEVPKPW